MFSSAGYGPVPGAVMDVVEALDDECERLDELPVVGTCVERPSGPYNYSFWVNAAERGIYGFDWNRSYGPYRRLTVPSHPRAIAEFPTRLAGLARLVSLDISFETAGVVDLGRAGVVIAPPAS